MHPHLVRPPGPRQKLQPGDILRPAAARRHAVTALCPAASATMRQPPALLTRRSRASIVPASPAGPPRTTAQ